MMRFTNPAVFIQPVNDLIAMALPLPGIQIASTPSIALRFSF